MQFPKANNRIIGTEADYFALFNPPKLTRAQKDIYLAVFKEALRNRQFEISLYWSRTNYGWAFLVLMFTGYFAIYGSKDIEPLSKGKILLLISSIGLVFSFGWYLVNRGSKYWQENWEKHVDMLEQRVLGTLFRTTIDPDLFKLQDWFSPLKVSVSRINQIFSVFITLVWVLLWFREIFSVVRQSGITFFNSVIHFTGLSITLICSCCFVSIVLFGTIFFLGILIYRTKSSSADEKFHFKTCKLEDK